MTNPSVFCPGRVLGATKRSDVPRDTAAVKNFRSFRCVPFAPLHNIVLVLILQAQKYRDDMSAEPRRYLERCTLTLGNAAIPAFLAFFVTQNSSGTASGERNK